LTEWRDIVESMRDEEVVFIVGIPRSGTTVLRASLDRLPRFAARQPWSPETKIFVKPKRVLDVLQPKGRRLFRYLLEDQAAAREMLAVLGSMNQANRAERAEDAGATGALAPENLVRVFFHFAKRARGVARLLEKTPRHLDYLDLVRATFPRSRVLVCIRHPVDVYSSYQKRLAKEIANGSPAEKIEVWRVSPGTFCQRFERWAAALANARHEWGDRLMVLPYETLTGDPVGALGQTCSFLEEPFDAEALLDSREVRRDQHGSPLPTHRIASNEKRWQDHLGAREAAEIQDRLGSTGSIPSIMETLGYARYS